MNLKSGMKKAFRFHVIADVNVSYSEPLTFLVSEINRLIKPSIEELGKI
jgi:hypothetical protein